MPKMTKMELMEATELLGKRINGVGFYPQFADIALSFACAIITRQGIADGEKSIIARALDCAEEFVAQISAIEKNVQKLD